MKYIKRNYDLKSNKVKKSVKIFHFTDLHYSTFSDKVKLESIAKEIEKLNVDYIVFTGDLIDSAKRFNKEKGKELISFFKLISLIKPVIIIKGNHDLKRPEHIKFMNLNLIYKEIFEIPNIYYLDGINKNSILFDDINFYGFELGLDHYYTHHEKNSEAFASMVNKIEKVMDKSKYNILLFHSPIIMFDSKKTQESIRIFDLVLTGHMHNGFIPAFFDIKISSRGIITPRIKFLTKYCKGIIKNGKSHVIIGFPVTFYYLLEELKIKHIYKGGYQVINISE